MATTDEMLEEMARDASKKDKVYKAKAHIATGQFSFLEVELEGSAGEIVAANDKLLARYEKKQV